MNAKIPSDNNSTYTRMTNVYLNKYRYIINIAYEHQTKKRLFQYKPIIIRGGELYH